MNKITTYLDLLAEKQQLEAELATSRAQIRADVSALKEEWKPIRSLLSNLGSFQLKDARHPLLSMGLDLIGNVLLKNILPSRLGWIPRAVMPILAKTFSGQILNKEGFLSRWLHKIRNRAPQVDPIPENEGVVGQ